MLEAKPLYGNTPLVINATSQNIDLHTLPVMFEPKCSPTSVGLPGGVGKLDGAMIIS